MADDVPDYMSDSFLKELEAAEKSSKSEEKKRLDKLKRKRAEAETKPRTASELAKERLEKGLTTPIAETNKGFQLLMKMGYTKGSTLGSSNKNEGLSDPLAIVIRERRVGLGSEVDKSAEIRFNPKRQKIEHAQQSAFRSQVSDSMQERKVIRDIRKLVETIIPDLDEKGAVTENKLLGEFKHLEELRVRQKLILSEAAPSRSVSSDSANKNNAVEKIPSTEEYLERFDKEANEARLQDLLLYTRKQHRYCFYCGAVYDTEEQLDMLCPGVFDDSH